MQWVENGEEGIKFRFCQAVNKIVCARASCVCMWFSLFLPVLYLFYFYEYNHVFFCVYISLYFCSFEFVAPVGLGPLSQRKVWCEIASRKTHFCRRSKSRQNCLAGARYVVCQCNALASAFVSASTAVVRVTVVSIDLSSAVSVVCSIRLRFSSAV